MTTRRTRPEEVEPHMFDSEKVHKLSYDYVNRQFFNTQQPRQFEDIYSAFMDLYVGEPSVRNDKDPNQSPFERLLQVKNAKDEALANLKFKLAPYFAQFCLEKNYYE